MLKKLFGSTTQGEQTGAQEKPEWLRRPRKHISVGNPSKKKKSKLLFSIKKVLRLNQPVVNSQTPLSISTNAEGLESPNYSSTSQSFNLDKSGFDQKANLGRGKTRQCASAALSYQATGVNAGRDQLGSGLSTSNLRTIVNTSIPISNPYPPQFTITMELIKFLDAKFRQGDSYNRVDFESETDIFLKQKLQEHLSYNICPNINQHQTISSLSDQSTDDGSTY
ncbi:hypothetical protein FGO68_gene16371 [Halteria grandinella]|uniref:Uncharacterized protein n=1 Tax=Halteria grandinella TaxID=5974 RepID=A0A8J8NMA7_HALGN|nr:hypothetical protein FGO68_gene16371 [Halteria grandinella]